MCISVCLLVFLGRTILRGIALEGGTRTMFEGAGVSRGSLVYYIFSEQVKMTCKSAFYRIHSIAKIRRYLSQDTAKTIVHGYITSCLDYCNALYNGLPKYLINALQLVPNSAACLATASRTHEHNTPILKRLHWLPVRFRI